MLLGFRLNFQENFENMLNKVNKAIRRLQKLQSTLPRLNYSLDQILILAISSMIKHRMHLFNKK